MSTYNPSNPMFTGSNKSYATQGKPDTAKQWYADSVTFENRPFTSRAEVLTYFDTALKRKGVTGAVVVEAGVPSEYWWPDITKLTDDGLVQKGGGVIKKSATKTQSDIISGYIPFTDSSGDQIPDNAIYNIEVTADSDGIGRELAGAVERHSGERRIYNLPEGDFNLTINYI